MASSEVDQKFLGKLARAVEEENPLLSSILFKILGLSLNLAQQLVAVKKRRPPNLASSPDLLVRVLHIIWLSREGLIMLQQYVIPMVGNYIELKVLAYKLRASFHHIFALFYNQPPISNLSLCSPRSMAAALDIVSRSGKARHSQGGEESSPILSSIAHARASLEGGPVGQPPGLQPQLSLVPPFFILPAQDHLPKADQYFREAVGLADQLLWGSHSLRLSVKMEYAAFLYDCIHDADASRALAKNTIAEVYDATEGMDDDMFSDACELVAILGKMMRRGLVSNDGFGNRAAQRSGSSLLASGGVPPGMENPI